MRMLQTQITKTFYPRKLCLSSIIECPTETANRYVMLKVGPPQMSKSVTQQIIHLAHNQSIVRIAWKLTARSVNQNVKQFTPI